MTLFFCRFVSPVSILGTMELRGVEKAKIECAEKLFNNVSTSHVCYHQVKSYQNLLDMMKKLE